MFSGVNKIVKKYQGKPYVCGVYDCNLMLLEYTGFTGSIEPFSNVFEGRKALRKAVGCKNSKEYLTKTGFKQIPPTLVTDGCVLTSGIHCFLYFDDKLFGVNPLTKSYSWFSVNTFDDFEVFQWA
ncbi:TPA: hypothetical protein PMC50_002511 [Vibrio cholerae]|nr:hypothetical protein [Vibrio cholerae]